MTEIVWKRGEFHTFFAQLKIRVGGKDELSIQSGDAFDFDGQILRYAGMEVSSPHIRSCIKQNWATLSEESEDRPGTVTLERNRAAAKSVNTDLNNVQRVGKGSSIATSREDEETVLQVSDRRNLGTGDKVFNVPTDRSSPKVMTANNNRKVRGMEINGVEEQEGVEVGTVRTSARLIKDVSSNSSTEDVVRLENISGSGYRPNNPRSSQHAGGIIMPPAKPVSSRVEHGDESDGVVIGKVRTSAKTREVAGGITITDTSNPSKKAAKQPAPVEKHPAPPQINTKIDPRVRIARSIDPGFPSDWQFNGKLADRLSKVHDHGVSPSFLEALYAAEGDQMRKLLQKEFPDQFQS
jgi:hypothetical protein